MTPLSHAGATWKEPKTASLGASVMVLAEVEPGVYEFLSPSEAAAYGGAAAELVETTPGSGIYDVVPAGREDLALARGAAVRIGGSATVSTILP